MGLVTAHLVYRFRRHCVESGTEWRQTKARSRWLVIWQLQVLEFCLLRRKEMLLFVEVGLFKKIQIKKVDEFFQKKWHSSLFFFCLKCWKQSPHKLKEKTRLIRNSLIWLFVLVYKYFNSSQNSQNTLPGAELGLFVWLRTGIRLWPIYI